MEFMLYMGVFWTVYGICGLLGIHYIPPRYRGHNWTKNYIRYRGISWLMVGIPWLVCYLVASDLQPGKGFVLFLGLALAVPCFIYSGLEEKKYKRLLEETEQK